MAIAAASSFAPPPPMDPSDKQKYRTRLASAGAGTGSTSAMNLHVSVGAHNLRILKKAGAAETPRSVSSSVSASGTPKAPPTPTSTSASKQRKYERKSKRFIWPDELHRLFVAAIFDIGLKSASPKALLSIMASADGSNDLTTEHLKSHLQKYRLNYERSRLEFLEFYDESARRSHKRRRTSVGRTSNANANINTNIKSSDPNHTAYVFPISHKCQRRAGRNGGGGGDNSSDDDSGSDAMSNMEDDESGASPTASSPRDNNDPPLHTSDVTVKSEVACRRSSPSPASTTPTSTLAPLPVDRQSSEPPTPTYTAPIQPYHTLATTKPKATSTSASSDNVVDGISDRMVVAAAAAAVAAVPFGGLSTLSDPQWNILSSLISPQLGANRNAGDNMTDVSGGLSTSLTASASSSASLVGAGVGKLSGALEPFSLSGVESADLQMQMHLAMQAQMNLHRQMLTRKVEVSQHLHNQQQQQQQQQSAGPIGGPLAASWSAGTSMLTTSRPPPSQTPQNLLSDLPSSRLLGSMLGGDSSAPSFDAFSQPTPATSSALAPSAPSAVESSVSTTLLGLQGTEFADAAALASLEAIGASVKPDESEASLADLYRWDKLDFSMDLDDDDLFGFLKS